MQKEKLQRTVPKTQYSHCFSRQYSRYCLMASGTGRSSIACRKLSREGLYSTSCFTSASTTVLSLFNLRTARSVMNASRSLDRTVDEGERVLMPIRNERSVVESELTWIFTLVVRRASPNNKSQVLQHKNLAHFNIFRPTRE